MKKIILFFAALMVLMSLANFKFAFVESSFLRVVISTTFLLLALKTGKSGKYSGIYVFGLILICDLFLIYWEDTLILYYIFHILFLLTLIYLTIRVLGKIKVTVVDLVVLGGFFAINSFILTYLGQFLSNQSESEFLKIIFFANGFLTIILVLVAFFFSIHKANILTSYFFLGILFLSLSELVVYAIIFMGEKGWQNIDIFLYSFSLFFLVRSFQEHVLLNKSENANTIAKKLKS